MKKLMSFILSAVLTLTVTSCSAVNKIEEYVENAPDLVIDQTQTVNTQKKLI